MAFEVTAIMAIDAVAGEVAVGLVAGSVAEAVVGDAVIASVGEALASGLTGELASGFIGDFLSTAATDVASATTAGGSQAVTEGLTNAAADTATTSTADAAAQANGIATTPQEAASLPKDAASTIDQVGNGGAPAAHDGATASNGVPHQDSTVWNNVSKWLEDNKVVANGAGNLLGGLGKGIIDSSTAEKNAAAQTNIAKNRTLWDLEGAQAGSAASGAFNQTVPFSAPGTPRQIRRPDGSLVYASPGIIAGKMGGV